MSAPQKREREALLALVRWLAEQEPKPLLPIHLHAEIRLALGDDFYRTICRDCRRSDVEVHEDGLCDSCEGARRYDAASDRRRR